MNDTSTPPKSTTAMTDPRLSNEPAVTRANEPSKKYRPSLRASHIAHILHLAKTDIAVNGLNMDSMNLVQVLAPFAAKIENEGVTPAYSVSNKPKANSLEALGGAPSGSSASTEHTPKQVYWEQCYLKFLDNPSSCNLQEINAANEHKYLHGLMNPEEEAKFEGRELNSNG